MIRFCILMLVIMHELSKHVPCKLSKNDHMQTAYNSLFQILSYKVECFLSPLYFHGIDASERERKCGFERDSWCHCG